MAEDVAEELREYNENDEIPSTGEEARREAKQTWRDVVDKISYKGIVHNMPYLLFVALLCIIYINNNNRSVAITRDLNGKSEQLKELRWKYRDIQARLMSLTSETEITNKAMLQGIYPSVHPAYEIKGTKDTAKKGKK